MEQNDNIRYTAQDFTDGRIFFNHEKKICLDEFQDIPVKQLNKRAGQQPFVVLPNKLSPQELQKINKQQSQLYNQEFNKLFADKKKCFIRDCSSCEPKLECIGQEIEDVEKLLFPEKMPLAKEYEDFTINIGSEKFNRKTIENIRDAYRDISTLRIKKCIGINSPRCRFKFDSDSTRYLQAEAYGSYFNWLKKVSKEVEKLQQELDPQWEDLLVFYNPFHTETNAKDIEFAKHLKETIPFQNEVESLIEGHATVQYIPLHDGAPQYFLKEAEKIIARIKKAEMKCDNEERLKLRLNQTYTSLKGFIRSNQELQDTGLDNDDLTFCRSILKSLEEIKEFMEENYEQYLNGTDREKVTLRGFMETVLHDFDEHHTNLFPKKKKNVRIGKRRTRKKLKALHRKKLHEFEDRYPIILKNWIEHKSQSKHKHEEKDFLHSAYNFLDKLFSYDNRKKNYCAITQYKERFEFHPAFYKEHITPFIESLNNLLDVKKSETEDPVEDAPKKNGHDVESEKKVKVISFKFKHFLTDPGAISSLHKAMLGKEISLDTKPKDFKNAFDNKPLTKKIEWLLGKGALYYFIQQMKALEKIEDMDIWIAAKNVFIFRNDRDYDMRQLAYQHPPKNKKLLKRIDTLINSI